MEGKQVQVEDFRPAYAAAAAIEKALARYQELKEKLRAGEYHRRSALNPMVKWSLISFVAVLVIVFVRVELDGGQPQGRVLHGALRAAVYAPRKFARRG